MRRSILLTLLLALGAGLLCAQSRNLDIYWIDVEGGAATLVVAPSGESLPALDTAYPEAERLLLKAHQGIKQSRGDKAAGGTPPLIPTLERLVELYDAWGRRGEADRWRKELADAVGDKVTR